MKITLFILCTLTLAFVSRRSLRNPKVHGFYRFFAFEGILILLFLNFNAWFWDPFTPVQIASWILLSASAFFAIAGTSALRNLGKPVAVGQGETNLPFENTSVLVTTGVFRRIRHPMYFSLLLLTWGIALKDPSSVPVSVAIANTMFLLKTAEIEERENAIRFGDAYTAYRSGTWNFVPYLY
jgi:protein-S-isoprenylcysteine O-methyltransferase Ste14